MRQIPPVLGEVQRGEQVENVLQEASGGPKCNCRHAAAAAAAAERFACVQRDGPAHDEDEVVSIQDAASIASELINHDENSTSALEQMAVNFNIDPVTGGLVPPHEIHVTTLDGNFELPDETLVKDEVPAGLNMEEEDINILSQAIRDCELLKWLQENPYNPNMNSEEERVKEEICLQEETQCVVVETDVTGRVEVTEDEKLELYLCDVCKEDCTCVKEVEKEEEKTEEPRLKIPICIPLRPRKKGEKKRKNTESAGSSSKKPNKESEPSTSAEDITFLGKFSWRPGVSGKPLLAPKSPSPMMTCKKENDENVNWRSIPDVYTDEAQQAWPQPDLPLSPVPRPQYLGSLTQSPNFLINVNSEQNLLITLSPMPIHAI